MCPGDVVEFRQKLGEFYRHVFNEQDPGILLSQVPGRRPFAIEDRFVVPDVVENRNISEHAPDETNALNDERDANGYEFEMQDRSAFNTDRIRQLKRPMNSIDERTPVEQWLCNSGSCVLLGEPGAGKSTLLRFLAIDLLRSSPYFSKASKRWGSYLPVWIPFALWTKLVSDNTCFFVTDGCPQALVARIRRTATNAAG